MFSLKINNVKNFMSKLLMSDVFDLLYISEATISTFNTFQISGQINKEYYTKEETESMNIGNYSNWGKLRPFCLELIKGNKTPSFLKIIFLLPDQDVEQLLNVNIINNISVNDINGLFINLKYANGVLTCITGTSLKIFTMDKSLEQAFDSHFQQFLQKNGIDFETL